MTIVTDTKEEGTDLSFPFVRGHRYSFGELRTFESSLLSARQRDQDFSADLRCNRLPWAKLSNEELFPIYLLGNHKEFRDSDSFTLTALGHPNDAVLEAGNQIIPCQVTIADPAWSDAGPATSGSYLHHLRMEQLRSGEPTFGGANIRKESGIIVSEPHARDVRDDIEACRRRLVAAISRKQTHDGSGASLLIFARGYRFLLIDVDVASLVSDAVREAGATSFERIFVVDEHFFWESD